MSAAIVAGGAGALGLLYGLDRFANAVLTPPRRRPERSVEELGVAYEPVAIPSGDRELAGWWLTPPASEGRPVVIVAHGWGACYGTVVDVAEPIVAAGHDVLLYDVRGHGRSDAAPWVSVRDFRDDVAAAVRLARARRPGAACVVVGHSLGASGAILAAAEGAPIDGLVSIAGPASVIDVTAEFLSERGLPGPMVVRLLLPFWWRRVGGTFRPLTPERRLRDVTVPMLFIQPSEDRRVPRHHAERLERATGQPYHLIEGAEHTDVLRRPETHDLVVRFLARVGSPPTSARPSPDADPPA